MKKKIPVLFPYEKESDYAPTLKNFIELTSPLDHRIVKFCGLLLLLLFLTFSALVANPKKTTLHGGQSWRVFKEKSERL